MLQYRSVALRVARGLGSDLGSSVGPAPPCTAPLQSVLEMRVPKELKRAVSRSAVVTAPGDLWRFYADKLHACNADPANILRVATEYLHASDALDVRFLVQAMSQLGCSFDPNSFWATGDKQLLKENRVFKFLVADLIAAPEIPAEHAPSLLYALACLEYRPKRLVDRLVVLVEQNLERWRGEVLANLSFSLAMLGGRQPVVEKLVEKLLEAKLDLHSWGQVGFSCVILGGDKNFQHAAICMRNACALLRTQAHLDRSGWFQFFAYQTLYAAELERPQCLDQVRSSIPKWVIDRIQFRWVEGGILTACQPQGVDLLQLDVDQCLRRTNTQALVNCSVDDAKPAWFAGHKLNPKIALEYNSQLDETLTGWLSLKVRLMQRLGYSVAVIHKRQWTKLTEPQKDDQIMLLRAQLGYVHDQAVKQPTPSSERPTKALGTNVQKWEDQPDWVPHLREPQLELTVHGYKPKDNPNFKGGVRVNFRRKHIANGNHNWINSLQPKG